MGRNAFTDLGYSNGRAAEVPFTITHGGTAEFVQAISQGVN